jgi:hypothetical protein
MVSGLFLFLSLASFAQTDKKANKARKHIAAAKQDLKEAKIDSAEDYRIFKKDAETTIADNKKTIIELKVKKVNDVKDEKYDKRVLALEKTNNDLEYRINHSHTTKSLAWTTFKREFMHDLNGLGDAIKNVGVNNVN